MFGFGKKKKKKKEEARLAEERRLQKIREEESAKEAQKEEKVEEVVLEEVTVDEAVEAEEAEASEEVKKAKPRKMAYHITKHSQGGWQIKKGGAQRALKRFNTQKEAIDYAKELEKERGTSYVIHKADGRTRKKTY